jgi:hypothetical protein
MNVSPPDPGLVEKLVLANRILYEQGIVDGLGHVSVRHASAPDTFLLSCNRAPGLVQPRDIVCYASSTARSIGPGPTWWPWCTATRPA